MAKTLKDLFLALINATLILVALCLVLLMMVLTKANSLSETFAQNLSVVAPLQKSVSSTRDEMVGLREDLTTLRGQTGAAASATLARVQARVDIMERQWSQMQESLSNLHQAPTMLVDHAIEKAAQEAVDGLADLRGCVPQKDGSQDN